MKTYRVKRLSALGYTGQMIARVVLSPLLIAGMALGLLTGFASCGSTAEVCYEHPKYGKV